MIKSGSILVINCGSSSIKFSVVDHETSTHAIRGSVERIGQENAELKYTVAHGMNSQLLGATDHERALRSIGAILNETAETQKELLAVGHRVVHGGETFSASSQIDEQVLSAIENCSHLAPLHNPANVMGIRTAQRLFPKLPQVAVFDTASTKPCRSKLTSTPFRMTFIRSTVSVATASMARAIDSSQSGRLPCWENHWESVPSSASISATAAAHAQSSAVKAPRRPWG